MNRLSQRKFLWELKLKNWFISYAHARVKLHQGPISEYVKGLPVAKTPHVMSPRFQAICDRLQNADAIKGRMKYWCDLEGSSDAGMRRWSSELFSDVMLLWYTTEKAVWSIERLRHRGANPPGRYMGWFANMFFTAKTREMVIEPMLADYRREVADAIETGRLIRERYLDLLYAAQFVKVTAGKWFWAIARLFFWWY